MLMSNEITTRNHIYDLKENTVIVQGKIYKIENNTLFLPCVRQSDNGDNIRENVLLEINLDEGTVGKKTKID